MAKLLNSNVFASNKSGTSPIQVKSEITGAIAANAMMSKILAQCLTCVLLSFIYPFPLIYYLAKRKLISC